MKNIEGIKADTLGGSPDKLGDLLYHEGPLLSLFRKSQDSEAYYLYKWCDCDDSANRWLVVQLTIAELSRFFNQKITLRTLFLTNPKLYLVDIGDSTSPPKVRSCFTKNLPEEYLPGENSMFVEEAFTDFAADFKLELSASTGRREAKLV